MARTRGGLELSRLFDAADQPVYALDEQQTLVYCNAACLAWIGSKAEDVLGKPCRYCTPQAACPPTGTDALTAQATLADSAAATPEVPAAVAGLCPPPSALAGRLTQGVLAWTFSDGRATRRAARFAPLTAAGEPAGVLVVVAAEELGDAPAVDALPEEAEAVCLHRGLAELCRRVGDRYRIDRLIGGTPAMRRVRQQVELAAAGRAHVLIVGPEGSGRHHVARAIHAASRGAGPLVPMDCAILEPELFGGTLASAAPRQAAAGEAARPTLLMAEVDQLVSASQAELARLLGGKTPVRILATARRSLIEMAQRGEYRADLAMLLSPLVIELPPLSQRRGDVPLLLQFYVEQCNAQGGRQRTGFSSDAMDLIEHYAWPGNIDELVKVVREAHGRSEGSLIASGDLPRRLHMAGAAAAHPRRKEEPIRLEALLASIEQELIRRALKRAKGNKAKAARLLGMTRPRLYRKLVQLGLVAPSESKADEAEPDFRETDDSDADDLKTEDT